MELSASRSNLSLPLATDSSGPQRRSGEETSPSEKRTPVDQSLAGHNTDWATRLTGWGQDDQAKWKWPCAPPTKGTSHAESEMWHVSVLPKLQHFSTVVMEVTAAKYPIRASVAKNITGPISVSHIMWMLDHSAEKHFVGNTSLRWFGCLGKHR
jgi:hypothetical protein